jgi:hypothetical protein
MSRRSGQWNVPNVLEGSGSFNGKCSGAEQLERSVFHYCTRVARMSRLRHNKNKQVL